MRCLNEWIARRANREDGCTGRFWESRFKCRHLLDAIARLVVAAYNDLNPIRAGMARTPEESDYTSVQDRILARQAFAAGSGGRGRRSKGRLRALLNRLAPDAQPQHAEDGLWLLPIDERHGSEDRPGLARITLDEYLQPVDATGRKIRGDKRGAIPAHLRPILERLDIDEESWTRELARTAGMFGTAVGSAAARAREALRRGTRWVASVLNVYREDAAAAEAVSFRQACEAAGIAGGGRGPGGRRIRRHAMACDARGPWWRRHGVAGGRRDDGRRVRAGPAACQGRPGGLATASASR
jgi:hypothetical protein